VDHAAQSRLTFASGARQRYAPWLGMGAIVGIYLVLAFIHYGRIGPYILDDSFIYFRYAHNFVAGHGLVYNVGERVEGYTGFTWVMLLSAAAWGGLPLVGFVQLAGVALGVATLLLTWHAARRLVAPGAPALLVPLFLATNRTFIVWSIEGLETKLFGALLIALLLAWLRTARSKQVPTIGLIAAALTFTRPEGLVFVGSMGLVWVVQAWRTRVWRDLVIEASTCLGLLAAHVGFRYAYYGDLLPNTFYAKVVGFQLTRGLDYLSAAAGANGLLRYLPLTLLGVVDFVTSRNDRRQRAWTVLASVIYLAYLAAIGGDYFEFRFLDPVLPFWALWTVAGGMGVARIVTDARLRWGAVAVSTALWLSANCEGMLLPPHPTPTRTTPESEVAETQVFTEIGRWLASNLQPHDVIAIRPAGAIAYLSGAHCLDMLGLNDRAIARKDATVALDQAVGHQRLVTRDYLRTRGVTYLIGYPRLSPVPAPSKRGLISIELSAGRFLIMERIAETAALEDRPYLLTLHR